MMASIDRMDERDNLLGSRSHQSARRGVGRNSSRPPFYGRLGAGGDQAERAHVR